MNQVTLLVLAAGMGSRYGGLKQLDAVGPNGETVIDYSVFDAIRAGFSKVVFIIREEFSDDFKSIVGEKFKDKIDVGYAYQSLDSLPTGFELSPTRIKPWGTGHAILSACSQINEPFAVINADDFYGNEAYEKIFEYLSNVAIDSSPAEFCMVGYPLKNTLSEHGSVSRGVCLVDDNCKLLSVNELTKIHELDGVILNNSNNERCAELTGEEIVSMNMWGFSQQIFKQLDYLFVQFLSANSQDIKSEFYIPFAVDDLIKSDSATVQVLSTKGKWFGVTYKEDKEEVEAAICSLISRGDYPSKLI